MNGRPPVRGDTRVTGRLPGAGDITVQRSDRSRVLWLGEDFAHLFGGASDDGSGTTYTDRAIHDLRMFEQQPDEGIGSVDFFDIPLQVSECTGVQHFFWFASQHLQKTPQGFFTRWILDVFDNVELDVVGAQDIQHAPGLASIGVVVDGDLRHVCSP